MGCGMVITSGERGRNSVLLWIPKYQDFNNQIPRFLGLIFGVRTSLISSISYCSLAVIWRLMESLSNTYCFGLISLFSGRFQRQTLNSCCSHRDFPIGRLQDFTMESSLSGRSQRAYGTIIGSGGCAPSGVQGQSSWWAKAPWSWRLLAIARPCRRYVNLTHS